MYLLTRISCTMFSDYVLMKLDLVGKDLENDCYPFQSFLRVPLQMWHVHQKMNY